MKADELSRRLTSTLLSTWPQLHEDGRRRRIVLRALAATVTASVLAALIVVIAYRSLPTTGLGHTLYFLHDNVYLPVKGYTFTRNYPESLIWWLAILIIVLLWTIFWIADRSLVRSAHIGAIRWTVKRRGAHAPLITATRLFARVGMQPHLIQNVVAYEWENLADALTPLVEQRPSATQLNQFATLTRFYCDLHVLPTAQPIGASHLRVLATLHQAVFLIYFHQVRAGNPPSDDQTLHWLFAALPPRSAWLQESWRAPDRLTLDAILSEIYLFGAACDPRLLARWFPDDPPDLPSPRALLRSLIEQRATVLEGLHRTLEESLYRQERRLHGQKPVAPLGDQSDEVRRLSGCILTHSALYTAWLGNDVDLALRSVNALDALKLSTALVSGQPMHAYAEMAQQTEILLSATLQPAQLAFLALMQSDLIGRRREAWLATQFAQQTDSLLSSEDLALDQSRLTALVQAAGPTYTLHAQEDRG